MGLGLFTILILFIYETCEHIIPLHLSINYISLGVGWDGYRRLIQETCMSEGFKLP